jgi:Peptidase inhibitor family I36
MNYFIEWKPIHMRKTTKLLMAATAAVVAGTVAPTAAYAANACPADNICLSKNTNQTGSVLLLRVPGEVFVKVNNFADLRFSDGSNLNDQVSSIRNNTRVKVFLSTDAGLSGDTLLLLPGEFKNSLGSFNDRLSSLETFPGGN